MLLEVLLLIISLAVIFTFGLIYCEFNQRVTRRTDVGTGRDMTERSSPRIFSMFFSFSAMILWFIAGLFSSDIEVLRNYRETGWRNDTAGNVWVNVSYVFTSYHDYTFGNAFLFLFFGFGLIFFTYSVYLVLDSLRG